MKQNPAIFKKPQNIWFAAQIFLRIIAMVATFVAAWLVLTAKETVAAYGGMIISTARYDFCDIYKFYAIANVAGCSISAAFILIDLILGLKVLTSKRFFCFFLGDLFLTILLISGCAAASAIGYIGKYGNHQAKWEGLCGTYQKFCEKMTISLMFSYFGAIMHLLISIISANNSRQQFNF